MSLHESMTVEEHAAGSRRSSPMPSIRHWTGRTQSCTYTTDGGTAAVSGGQRLHLLHRVRRRTRLHAPDHRADLRDPARTGGRQRAGSAIRRAGRQRRLVDRTRAGHLRRRAREAGAACGAGSGRRPILAAGNSNGDDRDADVPGIPTRRRCGCWSCTTTPSANSITPQGRRGRWSTPASTAGPSSACKNDWATVFSDPAGTERSDREMSDSTDLVWIPAQTAVLGSDAHYPEEAPAREVTVDGFWIADASGDQRAVRRIRRRHRLCHGRRTPLDPADYPGAPPENLQPGSMVFTRTAGPVDLRHINQWWTWTPGRVVAASARAALVAGQTGRSSRRAHRVRGRRGVCGVGGARVCPPRRNGRSPRGADSHARPTPGATTRRRPVNGWPTTGTANSRGAPTRIRADLARRQLPAQRLRAVRHGRQRVGVDHRLVRRHPGRRSVLRGGQLRPAAAAVPGPAQGDQGRIVPVRRQLLPALPARRAPAADGRYGHEPHRLSLHPPRMTSVTAACADGCPRRTRSARRRSASSVSGRSP